MIVQVRDDQLLYNLRVEDIILQAKGSYDFNVQATCAWNMQTLSCTWGVCVGQEARPSVPRLSSTKGE